MVALPSTIPASRSCVLMVYCTTKKQTIQITVDERRQLPIVLVDQSNGNILVKGLFTYRLGPAKFVLVTSDFPRLYYIVQGDQCTCPQREGCEHVQNAHLYGAIRNGKLVELTWENLTFEERHAAYVNYFNPCGGAAC